MAYDVLTKSTNTRDWSRGNALEHPLSLPAKIAIIIILGGITGSVISYLASRKRRPSPVPPTMFARPAPGDYRINQRAARAYFSRR